MPNDLFVRLPIAEPAGAEPQMPAEAGRLSRESARPDRGIRRLALIAGGIGGALLLAIGAWSLGRHGSGVVPVVQAPSGPMRVRPEDRGGMQVAGMNDPILSGDLGQGEAALAPPPETPKPKALRTQIEAEQAKARHPRYAQSAATRAAKPPVASEPASLPKPPAPPIPPEKPAPAPAAAPTAGDVGVQLAALKTEDAAKTEWERIVKRMPELLGRRHPRFVRAEHDGHEIWRLRTGAFADHAKAAEFCAKVRTKGGECVVSSF